MLPDTNACFMFKRRPDAQLIEYSASGDGVLFQHSDTFVQQVTLFLDAGLEIAGRVPVRALRSSRCAHENNLKSGLTLEGYSRRILYQGCLAGFEGLIVHTSAAREGIAHRDSIVPHFLERGARRMEFNRNALQPHGGG